jgi:hypothetical protein
MSIVPLLSAQRGSDQVNAWELGVLSDGGSFVAPSNTDDLYSRLVSLGLINSASLVNSCNGGKADALYNFVPSPVQSLDRFTVTRASTKNVIGSNGLYGSVANNVPAFEFNTDGTYRGLLVEPGATNLALRSQELGDAVWTDQGGGFIVTSNATTAPDGTTTADAVLANTGNTAHFIQQRNLSVTSGTAYTWSVFLKRNGYRYVAVSLEVNVTTSIVTLDFDTGLATGGSGMMVQTLPDGWYRLSATTTATATGSTRLSIRLRDDSNTATFIGDDTKGVFAWQAQLETGSVATSPIVTTAGTASRVADVITLTSASSVIGQSAGWGSVEIEMRDAGINRGLFSLSDGTNDNRFALQIGGANTIELRVVTATVTQGATTGQAVTTGLQKWAYRYSSSSVNLSKNGSTVASLGAITVPATSQVRLGLFATGTGNQFNGWIRSLALGSTDITEATLNSLTA